MTPSLRTARACRAAAALLLAAAGYAATHHPWLALPGLYAAAVFAWCAARARTEHRLRVARAQRAERLARPRLRQPLAATLKPCCAFWQHSDGAVHGPGCTRPAAARVPFRDDCCERWWTSLGARHDAGCRHHVGTPEHDRARTTPQ
ncbi:hypothetical protein RI578_36785 [Streptomyces sp. BB1-1-1]|uniref:hypothetical protein n=1 Tax=unclassified Streptomyces TaxID=2593676 RepID=UPI0028776F1A|nr:hypothetical protein [Streptomyces sp. BB1-1-1]WND39512.1 hypothetical protein RI578_36785 [Streptomyces sp. BB1-1-1]